MPRRKPYTEIGIRRVPCFRCGRPARFQWQVCADGRVYRPLCLKCDIAMNEMVLRWMRDPRSKSKMRTYRARMRRLYG